MGYREIGDHRFEGYDNHALAGLVEKFKSGDAAQRFSEASHALRELAAGLAETDEVLRRELGKLGIEWQGAAGDKAGGTITAQADYAGNADETAQRTSKATAEQSATFSQTRHVLPESTSLLGATQQSTWDKVAGFAGYETDHAEEVKQTQAAREQAIRGLDQYTEASRSTLDSYQGLNKPPNFDVTVASSATATVAHVATPAGHIGGVPTGLPASAGLPGGSVGLPGGATAGIPPQLPAGGLSGQLPGTPVGPSVPIQANPLLGRVPTSNIGLGIGLGLSTLTGLGIAGSVRPDRLVRGGGKGGTATGKAPEGGAKAVGKAGVAAGKSGISATLGAIDPDERPVGRAPGAASAATAAGNTRTGKVGTGTMLQPAASAKDEEDAEHVRKYGVDSDDVFGDERMVVQSVLGDDSERK
ncbi:hypothetical protein GCM10022243_51950 [Saccharothrix violaceirubra]|uniref:PPE family protein n=1 Tax=Saccharothrix violaceirubra TaxID=413306 RepID=A0A7W7TAE7_9PSEU|nr:hypothetical protein [Saccharothrix violaceirubra]MBB4969504.1 hypothetical protein [Saccharothrix violaceirubra]